MSAVRKVLHLERRILRQRYQAGKVSWPVMRAVDRERTHYGWIMWVTYIGDIPICRDSPYKYFVGMGHRASIL